ncbi:MAG: response regulator [Sciscionella sp.]
MISAVASLLWPVAVIVLLLIVRRPLMRVILSAEQREFTVKVGGQEVSFGEVSRQQTDLIADLQDQLATLNAQFNSSQAGYPPPPVLTERPVPQDDARIWDLPFPSSGQPPSGPWLPHPQQQGSGPQLPGSGQPQPSDQPLDSRRPLPEHDQAVPWADYGPPAGADPSFATQLPNLAPPSVGTQTSMPTALLPPAGVLWVDDHPENNAVQADRLQRNSTQVDFARTTEQAWEKLRDRRYQIVVSDMTRTEGGAVVVDAGIKLTRAIRATDQRTPIVIFTSEGTIRERGGEALTAGANLVTQSGYELYGQFRKLGLA